MISHGLVKQVHELALVDGSLDGKGADLAEVHMVGETVQVVVDRWILAHWVTVGNRRPQKTDPVRESPERGLAILRAQVQHRQLGVVIQELLQVVATDFVL